VFSLLKFNFLIFYIILFTFIATSAFCAVPTMRISVENLDSHIQSKAVRMFAEKLQESADGEINVEVYTSAKLYQGKDVIGALVRGNIEMAVPGSWHMSKYVPDVSLLLLPAFYGRDKSYSEKLLNGELGKKLNRSIENKLNAYIPGSWIDLGYAHLFFNKNNIKSINGLQGLNIRVAGGYANEQRNRLIGAEAITIAWPDLKTKLSQGQIDGLLTSYMTIDTAELDKLGVSSVIEDKQYFPRYIPIIRASFWKRLDSTLQEKIRKAWSEVAKWQRDEAEAMQQASKKALISRGIEVVIPNQKQIQETREMLLKHQSEISSRLGISSEMIEMVH